MVDGFKECAGGGLTGDDGGAAFAALKGEGAGVEPEPGKGDCAGVAAEAVLFEKANGLVGRRGEKPGGEADGNCEEKSGKHADTILSQPKWSKLWRMRLLLLLVLVFAHSASGELLVLHKGHSSLGFYTDQGTWIASAPVRAHPHEMVFSTDGRYAYTTDNGTMRIEQAGTGGNTVSIIDLKERRTVGEISLGEFRRPHGIDIIRATGQLLVSTELPDRLLLLDPVKRQVVRTWATEGKTAHMVVATPDGRYAFISNSTTANVSAIDLQTGKVKLIPTGARPEGSVVSKDGKRVYVCNRDAAHISVIDTATLAVTQTFKTSPGPVRIAITPDQRYVVYGLLDERGVEWADTQTGKIAGRVDLPAALGQIVSLHLSHDGKTAYAANENLDTVYAVSLATKKIAHSFKTAKGYSPDPVVPKP